MPSDILDEVRGRSDLGLPQDTQAWIEEGLERSHRLQVQRAAFGADSTMLQTHRNLVAPGGGDRTTEQRGQRTNSAVEEDLVERERLWLDNIVVRLVVAYIIFPHGHRNRSVLGGEINERLQPVQLIMSWFALFGGGPPPLPPPLPPPPPPPPPLRCGSILICETSLQYGQLTQTSPEELEGRFRARIFRHDPHRIRRRAEVVEVEVEAPVPMGCHSGLIVGHFSQYY